MKWVLLLLSPILLLGAGIIGLYLLIPKLVRNIVKWSVNLFIISIIIEYFYKLFSNYFNISNLNVPDLGNILVCFVPVIALLCFCGFIFFIVKMKEYVDREEE